MAAQSQPQLAPQQAQQQTQQQQAQQQQAQQQTQQQLQQQMQLQALQAQRSPLPRFASSAPVREVPWRQPYSRTPVVMTQASVAAAASA